MELARKLERSREGAGRAWLGSPRRCRPLRPPPWPSWPGCQVKVTARQGLLPALCSLSRIPARRRSPLPTHEVWLFHASPSRHVSSSPRSQTPNQPGPNWLQVDVIRTHDLGFPPGQAGWEVWAGPGTHPASCPLGPMSTRDNAEQTCLPGTPGGNLGPEPTCWAAGTGPGRRHWEGNTAPSPPGPCREEPVLDGRGRGRPDSSGPSSKVTGVPTRRGK